MALRRTIGPILPPAAAEGNPESEKGDDTLDAIATDAGKPAPKLLFELMPQDESRRPQQ